MEDLGRNISINSMKFYNDIAGYFHQYQDVNMLKQFYMQRSRLIAARANINLPAKDLKTKCQKCSMNKSGNTTEYNIVPHMLRNRFLRRIKKRVDVSKLTRYQLKWAKKIHEHFGNRLVVKCKICQNKSEEVLNKPEKMKEIIREKQNLQNKIEQGKSIKTMPNLNTIKKNSKQQKKQNKRTSQQISKLNKFLNTTRKVKSSSLKDFIKSIT